MGLLLRLLKARGSRRAAILALAASGVKAAGYHRQDVDSAFKGAFVKMPSYLTGGALE